MLRIIGSDLSFVSRIAALGGFWLWHAGFNPDIRIVVLYRWDYLHHWGGFFNLGLRLR